MFALSFAIPLAGCLLGSAQGRVGEGAELSMAAMLRPRATSIVIGEPVVLDTFIINRSDKTVPLCRQSLRQDSVEFIVEGDGVAVEVARTGGMFGGTEGTLDVPPRNGGFWYVSVLTYGEKPFFAPYPFTKPGRYRLRAAMPLQICDQDGGRWTRVESPWVEMEVSDASADEKAVLKQLPQLGWFLGQFIWSTTQGEGAVQDEALNLLRLVEGTRYETYVRAQVADAYWRLGDCTSALRHLRLLETPDTSSVGFRAFYQIATCANQVGDKQGAIAAYEGLIDGFGDLPTAPIPTLPWRVIYGLAKENLARLRAK